MQDTVLDKLLKVFVIFVIACIFVSIHFLVHGFYSTLFYLTMTGNVQGLAAYISSFGVWAVVITVFMITITNMTGLSSIPFLAVSGVIFGLVPGIIISWVGEVIGVDLGFIVMRTVLRDKAKKLIEKNNMMAKLDSYSNVRTMTFMRAIPYTPNVVITAMAALSHINFRDHTIATILGKIPAVIVEVWMGHDLLEFDTHGMRFLVLVTILFVVYGIYQYRKRRKMSKK